MPRPRMSEEEFKVWQTVKDNDFIIDQLSLLQQECDKAGIPIEDVKHYWYKSEQFSVFAKNRVKSYEQVKDEIIKELDQFSPDYPTIERSHSEDGHLLIIDPADIHIGKLSVASETGHEYNIQTAIDRVLGGVQELLNHSSGFEIDQIVLIIGNDALHVDSPDRKTTAGTPQDTDGMWHTAWQAAKKMYIEVIEMITPVADVHVVYDPSNHDFMQGFFLADALKSHFRKSGNISFDASICHRKYYQYYNNMIETDHGDGCKIGDTPMLMATEEPQMWAECEFRYSYKHHIHHKKKIPVAGFDGIGVNIEFLRTPSSPDGWHHRNGFVNIPAIESFVHSKDRGRVAQFTHYFKKQKLKPQMSLN